MSAFRMGIFRTIGLAVLIANVGSFASASDLDVFDLSESGIAVSRAYPATHPQCQLQVVETQTGHLEYCLTKNHTRVFEVQDRAQFEKWLSESWLVTEHSVSLSDRDVKMRRFAGDEGIYDVLSMGQAECIAFIVNTGRKVRAALTRPATEAYWGGVHCLPYSDGVEAQLIADVDAIRIRR